MMKLFRNSRFLLLLCIVEIMIIGYLAIGVVRKPTKVQFSGSDVAKEEYHEGVSLVGGELKIEAHEESALRFGPKIPLRSGSAYELEVYYECNSDIGDGNSKVILFDDDNRFKDIKQDFICLLSDANYTYGRVYVRGNTSANILVEYVPNDSLTIKKISLTERKEFILLKLILAIFGSIIIDWSVIKRKDALNNFSYPRVALIIVAIAVCLPCFSDFLPNGHDLVFHLERLERVAEELSSGQIPIRNYSDSFNGYGNAWPIFYGDFFYWFPAILYNCMVPLYMAYQIYLIFISLFTVYTSYLMAYRMGDNEWIGVAGSILYSFGAYRICCVWTRAAAGEYAAQAFLPLVVLGMYLIYSSPKVNFKNSAILGIGVAGIFMCHTLTTEFTVMFCVLAAIILWKKTFTKEVFVSVLLGAFLCLGLVAWQLIPFIHTMRTIELRNFSIEYMTDIQDHGTYLFQALNIFYSAIGSDKLGTQYEMPLSVGVGAISGLLAGIVSLFSYARQRTSEDRMSTEKKGILCYFLLGVAAICMSNNFFPWRTLSLHGGKRIALLANACQFSWRYLGIAAVCLLAVFILVIKENNNSQYGNLVKAVLCGTVILTMITYCDFLRTFTYESKEIIVYSNCKNVVDFPHFLPNNGYDSPGKEPADIVLVDGKANIDNKSSDNATFSLPIYAYKNVRVYDIDSNKTMDISSNENGLVQIRVPREYDGVVEVRYEEPLLWQVSDLVSLLTVVGICVCLRKRKSVPQAI